MFDDDEPFLPDQAPVEPDPVTGKNVPIADPAPVTDGPPLLTVADMRRMLRTGTETLDAWVGESSSRQAIRASLAMTSLEIDLIAPGLVRYANSRPAVRAAFGPNEYLRLGAGLMAYTFRVSNEHRAAVEDALDQLADDTAAAAAAPVDMRATQPRSPREAIDQADTLGAAVERLDGGDE